MDPLKTKKCSCCYADLLLTLYHRCTSARDGRQAYCIECKAKYNGRRANLLKARAA